MSEFIPLARADDVPPGSGVVVEHCGKRIALFNVAGEFYAVDAACPHQGGPIHEGYLVDHTITCPWHAWTFDLRTGECFMSPDTPLTNYEVRIERGEIQVML